MAASGPWPWAGTASAGWGTCGGTCRSAAAEAAVSTEAATGEAAASTTLGPRIDPTGRGDGARSRVKVGGSWHPEVAVVAILVAILPKVELGEREGSEMDE